MKCFNEDCFFYNEEEKNNCERFYEARECSQYKPEEKTMNVKQMTEDDFRNLLQESSSQTNWSANGLLFTYEINDSIIIRKAKEKGYIKQTELEIAKENYDKYLKGANYSLQETYNMLVKYKNELEKEVDRLKGK